ncbi:MAG: hypothetical protein WD851_21105 [Pirellulales bacterium]
MSDDHSMSVDDLQKRMAQLRGEVRADVIHTSAAAKEFTDWRYYVRQFPWVSAAAVAAVGFLLVPRKRPRPMIDEAALEKMVAEKRVVVIPQKQETAKKTMLGSVGGLIAAAAARAAMNYFSHRFTDVNSQAQELSAGRIRTPK